MIHCNSFLHYELTVVWGGGKHWYHYNKKRKMLMSIYRSMTRNWRRSLRNHERYALLLLFMLCVSTYTLAQDVSSEEITPHHELWYRSVLERDSNPINTTTTYYNGGRMMDVYVHFCGDNNAYEGAREAARTRNDIQSSMERSVHIHELSDSGLCLPEYPWGTEVCRQPISQRAQILANLPNYSSPSTLGPCRIAGVFLSVEDASILTPAIDSLVEEYGIPVVTYGSDAPNSKRTAYVGTNNTFLGIQLGKNLAQIRPSGGTYAMIVTPLESMRDRERGIQHALREAGGWTQIPDSPLLIPLLQPGNLTHEASQFQRMQDLIVQNITALIPVDGNILDSYFWRPWIDENRFRKTIVVSDGGSFRQTQMLFGDYVQGLASQIPYEMGREAANLLFDIDEGKDLSRLEDKIIGVSVISHVKIPYILPRLVVDHNLLQNLKFVGYTLFGIVGVSCMAAGGWVLRRRTLYVVQASQPIFLIMILFGVFLMASSIIPLSIDDAKYIDGDHTGAHSTGICMSVQWLAWTGFATLFSALFSKTWRINKVLGTGSTSLRRIKISPKDASVPIITLVSINVIILSLWTSLDPLRYTRRPNNGTDGWNRVLSTYGICQSENSLPYLLPLIIINGGLLAVANWQAYRARRLESEFAESKYIALTMGFLLQALLIGFPTLMLVRKNPQAYYLLLVILIFVLSMTILLFIFIPKIVFAETFNNMHPTDQARFVRESIRGSQNRTKSNNPFTLKRNYNRENPRDNDVKFSGSFDAFSVAGPALGGTTSPNRQSTPTSFSKNSSKNESYNLKKGVGTSYKNVASLTKRSQIDSSVFQPSRSLHLIDENEVSEMFEMEQLSLDKDDENENDDYDSDATEATKYNEQAMEDTQEFSETSGTGNTGSTSSNSFRQSDKRSSKEALNYTEASEPFPPSDDAAG